MSAAAPRAPTLNEALRAAGFTHRRCDDARRQYAEAIVDAGGAVVFVGRADEVWGWLRARAEVPSP